MAKYIKIQVQNPCNQLWDEMQPVAGGAYCSSCKKNVIDFTTMSDTQLMEYFKKYKNDVCGKFYPDQLENVFEIPSKKIPWLKYFFQISLPALLISYKTNAQRLINKFKEPVVLTENKNNYSLPLLNSREVSGKVTGINGNAIPYASVMIKDTNEGTAADSNGVFSLAVKHPYNMLEISAVGFETKLVPVTDSMETIQLNIALSENINLNSVTFCSNSRRYIAGGAHSVTVSRIWNNHKKESVKEEHSILLFPNPAKQNSQLTIQWIKPVNHNQLIILYNASGQKIMQETIYVSQPVNRAQINLRVHIAGFYTIHAIDRKTNKTQVAKLIIE